MSLKLIRWSFFWILAGKEEDCELFCLLYRSMIPRIERPSSALHPTFLFRLSLFFFFFLAPSISSVELVAWCIKAVVVSIAVIYFDIYLASICSICISLKFEFTTQLTTVMMLVVRLLRAIACTGLVVILLV